MVFSTQMQGRTEAFTNDLDLYSASMDGGPPVNLTDGNPAPDTNAGLLARTDASWPGWRGGARTSAGIRRWSWSALPTARARHALTPDWDRGPGALRWRSDGRALYAVAAENGQQKLFEIDARTGAVRAVTDEGTVSAYDERGGRLVLSQEGFGAPAQIVDASGEAPRALTGHNAEALAGTDLPEGESFTFAGWNGEAVQGWVFKPAGYVEGRRYPAVYLIHGGPKSPWTDGWSYRWNPQIYTGAGYAVVMVNFHGSPGFGQEFTDAINDHWGDRPLEDLQKGWASALQANAFIDGDRACALGASYGGYMVNLIAGKWNGPWRCLVNHAGVFDVGQLMNAMDIATFVAEFGGPSWDARGPVSRVQPQHLRRRLVQTHAGAARLARFPRADRAGAGNLLGPAKARHREPVRPCAGREPLGAEAAQLGRLAAGDPGLDGRLHRRALIPSALRHVVLRQRPRLTTKSPRKPPMRHRSLLAGASAALALLAAVPALAEAPPAAPAPEAAQAPDAFDYSDMISANRLADPQVSPDGRWVVYAVTTTDVAANTPRRLAVHHGPARRRRGPQAGDQRGRGQHRALGLGRQAVFPLGPFGDQPGLARRRRRHPSGAGHGPGAGRQRLPAERCGGQGGGLAGRLPRVRRHRLHRGPRQVRLGRSVDRSGL